MPVRTTPVLMLCWLLGALPVAGDARAADGPGLGNPSYSAAELFEPVSILQSQGVGQGSVAMVNGYMLLVSTWGTPDEGSIEFWDVSDPRNPTLHIRHDNADTHGLREAHGYGFSNSYGADLMVAQAVDGIQFWDVTDPDAITLLDYLDLPGIEEGAYTGAWWVFWQAPYVYVGGVGEGLYVVDASDPSNPVLVEQVPISEMAGISPAFVYAIGNLLVMTRNQGPSHATLDISDPENPVLLSAEINGNRGYSQLFAAGKILSSGQGVGTTSMGVYDVSADGTQTTFAGLGPTSCSGTDFTDGGYGSYQDGFFFSGFSNLVAKFDVASNGLVGCGSGGLGGDEDFGTVLGNLIWAGNDHWEGSALIPHQTAPDTTGPDVHWVHPADGASGMLLSTRVGVSMSDNVDIDSVDSTSFIVRPVGGSALPGKYSVQMGIVNFSPDQPLQEDTTYEVVVNGMHDVVGNVGGSFSSSFATGASWPPTCALDPLAPAEVGELVGFDVAHVSGSQPIGYSWDFGDGTPATSPSPTSATTHTYASPGRFGVLLTVDNSFGQSICSAFQIVHHPLTASPAVASSPIVHDGTRSYNVNPDNDTVTALRETYWNVLWEAPTGDRPRTLAIAPNGDVWVANQGDDTIHVLDPSTGSLLQTIPLPQNSQPHAVVFAPDGSAAYVTLSAAGRLLEIDPAGTITGEVDVGATPRGIAISGDSSRILVTRFVSPPAVLLDHADPQSLVLPQAEVREVDAASLSVVRTFPLSFDPGPDTESSGRGVPNYLSAVRISPDGRRAVVPSKKDNVARGVFLEGQPLSFESRTRTILSELDLIANVENPGARHDFNDADMAQSALFGPLGDVIFAGLQGSNVVEVFDSNTRQPIASLGTGRAPQGLTLGIDELGRTLLFVHNYMSRSVSIFDVTPLLSATGTATLLTEVVTVSSEDLSPDVLLGKQIFYDAADPRMSLDGYISCASCHLDGGGDGQVWDFTQAGEGLRNTIDLRGRAGMGHGNVHWTANFDEIQDFENDIRAGFSGTGFLSDPEFAATGDPLGSPKAGLSTELDALAAYVSSLDAASPSPHRDPGDALSAEGTLGQAVFYAQACDSCHPPPDYTDLLRHDVGTLAASSGQGIGAPLPGIGIDTPSLLGIWSTPPYLHNGAAATLQDVLANATHVGALSPTDRDHLVEYLLQVDEMQALPEPTGLLGLASGIACLAALRRLRRRA